MKCTDSNIKKVPNEKGIYYLKIDKFNSLPREFREEFKDRKDNFAYIGIGKNIRKRLEQELKGKGQGTFFRSIGAILKLQPMKLTNKKNCNYKFPKDGNVTIKKYILENFSFDYKNPKDTLKELEKKEIKEKTPYFNIIHNNKKSSSLLIRREACLKEARR